MLPQSIRAETSPEAITKVTRLFNGSADDVAGEVFQNARRAGARAIDVCVSGPDDARVILVRDDGRGIDDPTAILSLGRSGWGGATREAEDPAGMGFFALAGLDVVVRSWSASAGIGWRACIPADAWDGSRSIEVHPDPIAAGTEIRIAAPATWGRGLEDAIRAAAHFLPVPVTLDGDLLRQDDFLAEAVHVEQWRGSRIGVVPAGGGREAYAGRVNFHGVVARCDLPRVGEDGTVWSVRVDIAETAGLHLVLPARKEVVQNAALQQLREAAERAIYRAIAERPRHRLSYEQWSRAAALGIALPEAEPGLDRWRPATADEGFARGGDRVRTCMLIVDLDEPCVAQPAARALAGRWPDGLTPVSPAARFSGYRWYDRLPRLEAISFQVADFGRQWRVGDADAPPGQSGRVDSIALEAELVQGDRRTPFRVAADVAFESGLYGWGDLDDLTVYVAEHSTISSPGLVDLIVGSTFIASDDRDADSWQSQHDRFVIDAAELARTILLDAAAAQVERVRDVARGAFWFAPRDRRIEIVLENGEVEVRIAPPAEAVA